MPALADDAALGRLVIAAGATPHIYRLETFRSRGRAVRPRTVSRRLISLGHRPSTAAAAPCPHFATVATLARRKGYRLVGANRLGFNTIYVREGLALMLPAVSVESILSHPRNKERATLFEPIKDWKYEEG